MDLADTLKTTLDRTLDIAVKLETINQVIHSSDRPGLRARQRIQALNKDIRVLSSYMPKRRKKKQNQKQSRQIRVRRSSEVVRDYPTFKAQKLLSKSIRDVNNRVKLSKAGKKTIGGMMSQQRLRPTDLQTEEKFRKYFSKLRKSFRNRMIDGPIQDKYLPYVSMTNGKVQDPVYIPSFEEYLKCTGQEYLQRTANDDLFQRIQKAEEQLSKLMENLETRAFRRLEHYKEKRATKSVKIPVRGHTKEADQKGVQELLTKTNLMKKQINSVYSPLKPYRPTINKTKSVQNFVDAQESLQESLRNFYKSKAFENQKLTDILLKLDVDRPLSLKVKTSLIQTDTERYRNKLHSLQKFHGFQKIYEKKLRIRQHINYQQALSYINTLDYLKIAKFSIQENELLLIEMWRQMIQKGWVITTEELDTMLTGFSVAQLKSPQFQDLVKLIKNNL